MKYIRNLNNRCRSLSILGGNANIYAGELEAQVKELKEQAAYWGRAAARLSDEIAGKDDEVALMLALVHEKNELIEDLEATIKNDIFKIG